jgi:hypothetical protein
MNVKMNTGVTEVDKIDSKMCLVAGFGITSTEALGPAAIELVYWYCLR